MSSWSGNLAFRGVFLIPLHTSIWLPSSKTNVISNVWRRGFSSLRTYSRWGKSTRNASTSFVALRANTCHDLLNFNHFNKISYNHFETIRGLPVLDGDLDRLAVSLFSGGALFGTFIFITEVGLRCRIDWPILTRIMLFNLFCFSCYFLRSWLWRFFFFRFVPNIDLRFSNFCFVIRTVLIRIRLSLRSLLKSKLNSNDSYFN